MDRSRLRFRMFKDRAFTVFVIVLSFSSMVPLFLILFYILRSGLVSVNWAFFIEIARPVGEKGGGESYEPRKRPAGSSFEYALVPVIVELHTFA